MDTQSYHVRMDEELAERIRAQAKRNELNFSAYIRMNMKRIVQEEEMQQKGY